MQPFNLLKSKTLVISAMMGIFLAFSCSPETDITSSENLEAVNATANNGKRVERPWKVESSGTFQAIGLSEQHCPDGAIPVAILLEGSGNASHVGLYEVAITWCTNVDADLGSPDNFIIGTLIAANGDSIYFESVSFNGPSVDYIVTGGTGRFEGATGTLNLATTAFFFDPATGAGTYANEGGGTLVY